MLLCAHQARRRPARPDPLHRHVGGARLAGVHAVLTHEDVPGRNAHGVVSIDWPVLCGDKVRYAGDAVAIVAADTEEIAAAALDLIDVDYEELPAVSDAIDAASPTRRSSTRSVPTATC